jgi:hypothetical protein
MGDITEEQGSWPTVTGTGVSTVPDGSDPKSHSAGVFGPDNEVAAWFTTFGWLW